MPDPPCKNFLTWTENVIVTILSHFLRTCTPFSPMGCRWIGAWAWTLLCSISASSTALVPVSPWCPAPIYLKKEQFNTFQSLPFFQYSRLTKQHFQNVLSRFVAKEVLTWTQNIIIAVLSHVLQTCTRFSSMGCGRICAWARTLLCTTTTSHAAFVPITPWRPATIY